METRRVPVSVYSMKLRLYPGKEAAAAIDRNIDAMRLFHNVTWHEIMSGNPEVTNEKDGCHWPDFAKAGKAAWTARIKKDFPTVAAAPSDSITSTSVGVVNDMKKEYAALGRRPVEKIDRKEISFYSQRHPRRSFATYIALKTQLVFPENGNPGVVWIRLPKISKPVKARGFNRKVWFGENGNLTLEEAVASGAVKEKAAVRISRDTCGSYWAVVTISADVENGVYVWRETAAKDECHDVGVDVGIKDLAILSDGTKYGRGGFRKASDAKLRFMNRRLSRQFGPANKAFRDYNKAAKAAARNLPETETLPPATASRGYEKTRLKKAVLERKIANRRDTYQHNVASDIAATAGNGGTIGVETLRVKNMMRNHKLAYSLSDAAMSGFAEKLKYKAERAGATILYAGMFDPTSQICSECGYRNEAVRNLGIRTWTCPECGTVHDRDVNAAKNILSFAVERGSATDEKPKEGGSDEPEKCKAARPRKPKGDIPGCPELAIVFSKELTTRNNSRYIITNKETGAVVDDAQGAGYRSISNARNCFKARIKWAESH